MDTRGAFIWELIGDSPFLRDEIALMERIDDTDRYVGELLCFYREVDAVVSEIQEEVFGKRRQSSEFRIRKFVG